MRKGLVAGIAALAALGASGAAEAKVLPWHGTVVMKLGAHSPVPIIPGSGVATVSDFSGNALHTLRIPGTNTGSGIIPFTDPKVTVTTKSIRISAGTRPATFRDFKSPPLTLNQGALSGSGRICVLFPNCAVPIPLPLSRNGGATAIGVGGVLTVGFVGSPRYSLYAQPWTIGTASAVNQTLGGGFVTNSAMGFVHGPASATSSAAQASGVVQLVTPTQIYTYGVLGNVDKLSLYTLSIIHFVPEPGSLLLLGAGAAGLAALGRRRLRG